MKVSSIHFPWEKVEKGQGFFIPCLDTDSVRELGLRKAVLCRVLDARAKTGVYEGFTGVFFFRLPDRKPRPLDSVSP
jgi:hypothetical protein